MKKLLLTVMALMICSAAYSASRLPASDAAGLSPAAPPVIADQSLAKLAKADLSARKYKVHGMVRLSRGTPVAGIKVSLYQMQDKAELLRGSAKTNRNGAYTIVYSPRGDAKGVSIFIRVTSKRGNKLYQSPTIRTSRKSEQLNAVLP